MKDAKAGPALAIRLSTLPDIDDLAAVEEAGLAQYGRFAVLEDGSFWFAEARSSHPLDTAMGFYWAISAAGELLVSARSNAEEGHRLFHEQKPLLGVLVEELITRGLMRKPGSFEFFE